MKKNLMIPAGKLAGDLSEAELKRKREQLKEQLLSGKKITISPEGNVTEGNGSGMVIPAGKLAGDLTEAELKRKREQLKEQLLSGKKITISPEGNVTEGNGSGMVIPAGKLAALLQWYEKNPTLLEEEKAAMNHFFPNFTLDGLADGRLCWMGSLNVGILGDNNWQIMAVYQNNHPNQVMGSSVRVYLVDPDIEYIKKGLGWRPHHLLPDENGNEYLCTAEASNIRTSENRSTSAASVLGWAVKWLMALELVLTGNLSREQFDTPGVV